jgi:hypothetical protein
VNAKDIIRKYTQGKLATRPSCYSGRGATTSDLNQEILENLYQGILEEIGQEAATAFAQMVADTKKLSATRFLNNLYYLETCGWKRVDPKNLNSDGKDIEIENDLDNPAAMYATGFATIAGALSRSDRLDETNFIKNRFLHDHAAEIDYDAFTSSCRAFYSDGKDA